MLELGAEQIERWSKDPFFVAEESFNTAFMRVGVNSCQKSEDDGSGQMGDLTRQALRNRLLRLVKIEEIVRDGIKKGRRLGRYKQDYSGIR